MTGISVEAVVPDLTDRALAERDRRRQQAEIVRPSGRLGDATAERRDEVRASDDLGHDGEVRDAHSDGPRQAVLRERAIDAARAPRSLRDDDVRANRGGASASRA